jgi:hypothetical protein
MVAPSQKRTLTIWIVGIWLIIGPFISFYLFQLVVPKTPPTHNEWIDLFWRPVVASALSGIPLFFLPIRPWQRILAIVLYAPLAGYWTMLILLYVACYAFHNCL